MAKALMAEDARTSPSDPNQLRRRFDMVGSPEVGLRIADNLFYRTRWHCADDSRSQNSIAPVELNRFRPATASEPHEERNRSCGTRCKLIR
jgi:hypothetical protein